MIACSHCGTENTDAHVTCTSCGGSLEEAAARKLIGTVVLGVYQIVDLLGQGGMSVVYKARHKLTEQLVALKILPPELAVHSALKARFVEEAKALAKLEHPNIVHLYNFGEETGRFVLAMQFVEGVTFEKKIFEAERMPWREAVRIVGEVLRALEYAHGRGVIHRDIKPSNVIVKADGTAKIMDFGIAKIQEASGRLTAQGQTMGTVRYMSPEQVRGDKVDARSDLYSLGAALFEAVSGDTPFDGNTHFEIMTKHLSEPPPSLKSRGIDVPAALEATIMKALAKAPEARFQSAGEFRNALVDIVRRDGGGVTGIASSLEPVVTDVTHRTRRAPARKGVWIALAVVVMAASAGVMVFARRLKGGNEPRIDAPTAAPVDLGWREPLLVDGLTPKVDQRFEASKVRVVSSSATVDAAKVAGAYVSAREDFTRWVIEKQLAPAVQVQPVTLVVAGPKEICADVLYGAGTAPKPSDCENNPVSYRYTRSKTRTLYVLEAKVSEPAALAEAAAFQVCNEELALLERGCVIKAKIVQDYVDDAGSK